MYIGRVLTGTPSTLTQLFHVSSVHPGHFRHNRPTFSYVVTSLNLTQYELGTASLNKKKVTS